MGETKIYTDSEGKEIEISTMNNFHLVNALLKLTGVLALNPNGFGGAVDEYEKVKTTHKNLKDELFARLAPTPEVVKGDLIEALNHLDELADIGSEEGEEKSDQMKSYSFLYNFLSNLK